MDIRDKHLKAKKEKKQLRREIISLQEKIKRREKKILKKEAKIDELNKKIKKFKKKLRKHCKDQEKKEKAKREKTVKKEKALVPASDKRLRKIKKTTKQIVPNPDMSVRMVENQDIIPGEDKSKEPDDLTLIEGIGVKTQKVLNEKGIYHFGQLASVSSEALDEIIKESFQNHRLFHTLTWPEQAILAHNGQWDELKTLQEKLKGGK